MPPVSTTLAKKVEKFATGIKMLAKMVEKFAAGVVNTSGKFASGVIDTSGAPLLVNISANFRKSSKRF